MTSAEIATIISSAAATVAAAAVVVTAVIYLAQLRAMTRARELDSLLAIMRSVDSISFRRARYVFLEHHEALRPFLTAPFSWDSRTALDLKIRELSSSVELHDVDLVLNALNNASYLIRHGFAPADSAEGFLKNSMLHSWNAFEGYIRYRRTRPDTIGERSRYAEHFEWVLVNKYGRGAVAAEGSVDGS